MIHTNKTLKDIDHEIHNIIDLDAKRQEECIELIGSENFVSKAVLAAQGLLMTNKCAEGYPRQEILLWVS